VDTAEGDVIELREVNKSFWAGTVQKHALRNATATFERGRSIGILGPSRSGKTTLLNLVNGMHVPDSGELDRTSSVSWLVGSQRVFARNITYRANIRITSLMYGVSPNAVLERILRVIDLRPFLDYEPRDTPRSLQAKFAYVLCLAIKFDYYVIDEGVAPKDGWIRELLENFISSQRGRVGFLITSREPDVIRRFSDVAYTMRKGRLKAHETVDDAIRAYEA
jgi:capsular polysaccharide transport system ATP-binding protein